MLKILKKNVKSLIFQKVKRKFMLDDVDIETVVSFMVFIVEACMSSCLIWYPLQVLYSEILGGPNLQMASDKWSAKVSK